MTYGGEIEVRGSPLLVGQAKALNRQKNAINISNIVAADQIGRFPDKNASEATQRIPGVSLLRDQGEGRYVMVRGTEARLNSTTINGERIPSPEAGQRNVALDTIPADLLESIEVSKALKPDMDGDSIGGTVDLVTLRAPEEMRLSGSLGTVYTALMEETAPTAQVTFGTRFSDNRWGLIASLSGADRKGGSDNIEPGYDDGELVELELRDYTVQRERYGFTADLDYQASTRSNYHLRFLRTNYKDTEIRRAKGNIVEDNELLREIKDRLQESWINSLTFGGENTLGTSWVMDYRVMWNKSQEETPNQVTSAFIQEDVEFATNVSPGNIDPNNIQAVPLNEDVTDTWFDELEAEYKNAVEEDYVGALNFTNAFYKSANYSGLWKFGVKARFKTKEQDENVFKYEAEDDLNYVPFLSNWNSETPFFLGRYGTQIVPFQDPELMRDLLADFEAGEDTLAAYGMGEFILGAKTTFMGGVRVENTENDYTAYELVIDEEGDPVGLTPVTGGKKYTEWLPQFHLVYKTGDNSQLRAALTRSLARPNFEDNAPWRLFNQEDGEIELGNPDLDVTTAWNADLMWEQYFEPIGIFSAGVFYKKLYDYIFLYQIDGEVDGEDVEIIQPRNGDTGDLTGFEVAFQNQFTSWDGFWGGFGLFANYTYADSTAQYPDRDSTILPGQSEHTGNLALVFEKYGVTTRLSWNFNGKNILEIGEDTTEDVWVDDHSQLDFLFRVQLSRQFSIVFEAINITNEPYTTYEGAADMIIQQEYYDWWATLGVRFDL
jgi:TonB-dependent receptor